MGEPEVLQPEVRSGGESGGNPDEQGDDLPASIGSRADGGEVRGLRGDEELGQAPQGPQSAEQCDGERGDAVRQLPHKEALEGREAAAGAIKLRGLWRAARAEGLLPETLAEVCEVWRSLTDQEKQWAASRVIGPCWIKRLRKWNKETLKAAGNANPPVVPYLVGCWLMGLQL